MPLVGTAITGRRLQGRLPGAFIAGGDTTRETGFRGSSQSELFAALPVGDPDAQEMPPLKPPQARKGKEFSGRCGTSLPPDPPTTRRQASSTLPRPRLRSFPANRDSAANEREKPDLDAPIVWDAAELEDLRFGATVGLSLTGVVLAVYVRTMHPTIAGGDSGASETRPALHRQSRWLGFARGAP